MTGLSTRGPSPSEVPVVAILSDPRGILTRMCSDVPVRLVEWNVAMSLQTKTDALAALQPSIAVLPESAHPSKTWSALQAIGATSVEWVGGNPNKGLSVVGFDGWQLRIDDSYDPGYQWVMPIHASGPARIRLLAVWDMNHRGSGHESARRWGACRASMAHYQSFLTGPADLVIVSGDFNNSVYWDSSTKPAKFGDFMNDIEARGFVSVYHHAHGCQRGAEPHPTLWWTRNVNKPYHIDYTFVSRADAVGAVTVGSPEDWLPYSDHSPMTVDLRIPLSTSTTQDTRTDHPADPRPPRAAIATPPAPVANPRPVRQPNRVCFDLEPDAIPDMTCGVNGVPFEQTFRPTYVTAQWAGDVLVEVRIWGPRVLQDGSLGKRELDHRWRRSRAAGGVSLAELPPLVAGRLQSARDLISLA